MRGMRLCPLTSLVKDMDVNRIHTSAGRVEEIMNQKIQRCLDLVSAWVCKCEHLAGQ